MLQPPEKLELTPASIQEVIHTIMLVSKGDPSLATATGLSALAVLLKGLSPPSHTRQEVLEEASRYLSTMMDSLQVEIRFADYQEEKRTHAH